MNIPANVIYLCSSPETWEVDIPIEKTIAGHNIGIFKGRTIGWPKRIEADCINPRTLEELKEKVKSEKWLFIDRIKGIAKWVSIHNHVNRAGYNFLCGNTPYGDNPMFPDVSRIYRSIEGFDSVVVHTVGPERFTHQSSEKGVVWSEAVGLVTPVAHYVGISIYALGGKNIDVLLLG